MLLRVPRCRTVNYKRPLLGFGNRRQNPGYNCCMVSRLETPSKFNENLRLHCRPRGSVKCVISGQFYVCMVLLGNWLTLLLMTVTFVTVFCCNLSNNYHALNLVSKVRLP